MEIRNIVFFLSFLMLFSCSDSESISEGETNNEARNLQEYIDVNDSKTLIIDDVIACAASLEEDTAVSYVIYYPIATATNIQYFETENATVAKDDFELYELVNLETKDFFNGYLEIFVRNKATESWGIVTFETEGEIHVSNPIRLKNATKPTEWTDEVGINKETPLMPQFSWEDGRVEENAIYFEVLSTAEDDLISGTYTFDKWFQFYKLENVVLNITEEVNPVLEENKEFNFTMMGVSEDNWVNLVLQKKFTTE